MYPEKDTIERERVEWVFGLTGGELSDAPLRYVEIRVTPRNANFPPRVCCSRPDIDVRRGWAPYWYEGVPDYSEIKEHTHNGSFLTIVNDSGSYGTAQLPRVIYAHGRRWRRVASYASSGEHDCPEGRDVTVGSEMRDGEIPPELCPLCEAERGELHGCIYLGDGWQEVVYYSRG